MVRISNGCSLCWKLLQLVARITVELRQHKTSNIIRTIENCLISKLHGSKTKGVIIPTNGWLAICSALMWCKLDVHSTLRLGAYKHVASVWLTLASSLVVMHHKMFRIRRLSTQALDIEPYFSIACLAWSKEHPKSTISKRQHGHLATSGLTAPTTFCIIAIAADLLWIIVGACLKWPRHTHKGRK